MSGNQCTFVKFFFPDGKKNIEQDSIEVKEIDPENLLIPDGVESFRYFTQEYMEGENGNSSYVLVPDELLRTTYYPGAQKIKVVDLPKNIPLSDSLQSMIALGLLDYVVLSCCGNYHPFLEDRTVVF